MDFPCGDVFLSPMPSSDDDLPLMRTPSPEMDDFFFPPNEHQDDLLYEGNPLKDEEFMFELLPQEVPIIPTMNTNNTNSWKELSPQQVENTGHNHRSAPHACDKKATHLYDIKEPEAKPKNATNTFPSCVLKTAVRKVTQKRLSVNKCMKCSKAFGTKELLTRHRKTAHPGFHQCPKCSRSFKEKSKLKRHDLVHTGERAFQCYFPGCEKKFALRYNLTSHIKLHFQKMKQTIVAGVV